MRIAVDEGSRSVTFLYRLEAGVAEGSFGMHCAAMCGVPRGIVERAEDVAASWEGRSRLRGWVERVRGPGYVPLGWQSDVAWMLREGDGEAKGDGEGEGRVSERALGVLMRAIEVL